MDSIPKSKGLDTFNTTAIKIDTASGIRPLKNIHEFPYSLEEGLLILLLVLALLGGLYFIYRKYPRKLKEYIPRSFFKEDPFAWAESQILLLQNQKLNSPPFLDYFTQISDIVRVLIWRVYQVDALHFTSTQALREIEKSSFWDTDKKRILKEILNQADQVKFSGKPVDAQLAWDFTQLALDFVRKPKIVK